MLFATYDISAFTAKMQKIKSGLPKIIDEALHECAMVVAGEESKWTKGKMSRSFYIFKAHTAWVTDNRMFYAKWIEFGRPAFSVKKAKALRFWIDGEIVFCKSVKAAPPQPFRRESVMASMSKIDQVFSYHLDGLLK